MVPACPRRPLACVANEWIFPLMPLLDSPFAQLDLIRQPNRSDQNRCRRLMQPTSICSITLPNTA